MERARCIDCGLFFGNMKCIEECRWWKDEGRAEKRGEVKEQGRQAVLMEDSRGYGTRDTRRRHTQVSGGTAGVYPCILIHTWWQNSAACAV